MNSTKKPQFTTLHLVLINQNLTEIVMLLLTLQDHENLVWGQAHPPHSHPNQSSHGFQNLNTPNSYFPLSSLGFSSDLPDVIEALPCDKHQAENLVERGF